MHKPIKFVALGIEHRHIFGMAQNMLDAGAEFVGWWTEGEPDVVDGFVKRFPNVPRAASKDVLLADDAADLVLIADIPAKRADLAISAMEAGKDVMSDKPGCTTFEQLTRLRETVTRTKRIWTIDFSERFEVPSVTKASELVAEGAIGRVIQTIGMGPHRLNRATRPQWFFDREAYGGILTDIASHQIDQFMFFTGSTEVDIVSATVANYNNPNDPGLQDFGEILLRGDRGHGYIRVDWYTPDTLPTWGDGRLTILGTEGYIELRKYVDIGNTEGTDRLILVNGGRCEYIDASNAGLPYFGKVCDDIRNRTDTAMTQEHVFKVCELALQAQAKAEESRT
ncbi:Gfo/Idh/MocA family protein [Agrobacterium rubi]|uniref:Gfo/Idh/MocA family oxidoreductase n=1 Tax=Agrobacterium rubi TaxID=28099 RepID=A0AAE7UPM6_9HYPH|nr:Gfo/Idh/MocA family oxidoreductase [Agrobacterium rubi]NTE88238.1 Gfo/Idh/MocA family oxidoreductase [Agrobacterium rubi]NTF04004.1 Gfo/Idh/MocA family oxidoreductase [Agrobacterium rubi]NTF38335.1 Gfo/Idh/MocA family oxidoreductase [Agrobacterium rubi]OCJ47028.1 oxidoreductase [Agrobacterium rubi]QTG02153.1 Gfo/Idh/MocA family oxidoreductase [Agrobacterium rubi]